MNQVKGTSLVELLISLGISSLIMACLLQLYSQLSQSYLHIKKAVEKEMELQLTVEWLRDSARNAGYTPCLALSQLQIIDPRNTHNKLTAVTLQNQGRQITFHRMGEPILPVLQKLGANQLLIRKNPFKAHHPLFIADCYHGEFVHIRDTYKVNQGIILLLQNPLKYHYLSPYIGEWQEEAFYIKTNPQGQAALYYKRFHEEELTSWIQAIIAEIHIEKNKALLHIVLEAGNEQRIVDTTLRNS